MSGWAKLTEEQWREYLQNNAREINITTNPFLLGRGRNSNCFYLIEAEHPYYSEEVVVIRNAEGNIALCECHECLDFGEGLNEYHSIFQALRWVKENLPSSKSNLFVNSERFRTDLSLNHFRAYKDIYECKFLSNLGESLKGLLSSLNVEVMQISPSLREEIIPLDLVALYEGRIS